MYKHGPSPLTVTHRFLFNLAAEKETLCASLPPATFLQPISEPLSVELLPVHMKEMWAMRDLQQLV